MRCWISLWLLIVGLTSSGLGVARETSAPIKLPPADYKRLEDLVCKSTTGLPASRIKAFQFSGDDNPRVSAIVECQSHGDYKQKPMRYIDDCDFTERQWRCSPPQLELLVTLKNSYAKQGQATERDVKVRPWSGVTPALADSLITQTAGKGMFQGVLLDTAIGDSCDVSLTKDADLYELSCAAVIHVSLWCPQVDITGCPRIVFLSPYPNPSRR